MILNLAVRMCFFEHSFKVAYGLVRLLVGKTRLPGNGLLVYENRVRYNLGSRRYLLEGKGVGE